MCRKIHLDVLLYNDSSCYMSYIFQIFYMEERMEKDDLADAFLYIIYYLQNKKH